MSKQIKVSQLLFFCAYIPWVIFSILKITKYVEKIPIYDIYNCIRFLTYFFILCKIIYEQKYSIKVFVKIILLILILFITMSNGSSIIIDILLFVFAVKNIDYNKIIKVTYILQIVLMLFIILSSSLSIIDNTKYYRDDGSIRYGLGYNYCTTTSIIYFFIVLMFIYLKKSKIKCSQIIVILSINYILYKFSDSRTHFYLTNFVIIIAFFMRRNNNYLKNTILNKIIFEYCFFICSIISFLVTYNYNYNSSTYNILNNFLSGRLELGYNALKEYGISILGQNIIWVGSGNYVSGHVYNYVDSSYIQIAISQGIIFLALICIAYTIILKYSVIKNYKFICIILMSIAIQSMIEPHLISLTFNPFILLVGKIRDVKYEKI